MRSLRVGQIINTHGIKGGLKVIPLTDFDDRFEELKWVFIEGLEEKFYITSVQYQKNNLIITFKGYQDINLVEKFKGKYLIIDETQRRQLPEDTYYIADILGLEVYTVEGDFLGKIKDVLQAGSNEVYLIEAAGGKEIMIPAVKEFVPEIDLENKRITVKPIEGMIE